MTMNRSNIKYYAAAATTAIAGIVHLTVFQNVIGQNTMFGTFFLVAGIAQLFWVIPTIRKWGTPWNVAGIVGTAMLIGIWTISRMPDNPISGRAFSIGVNSIIVEAMQSAFIILLIISIVYERRRTKTADATLQH